jgi:BlaI family transcriptional regulator, penicillinase repressor
MMVDGTEEKGGASIMAKREWLRPTDAELAILKVLWRQGPSTVRQVWEAIKSLQPTGYTTALKQLQIMAAKGIVDRDLSQRSHVYRARFDEDVTQKRLVDDLMERAFGGSAERLVMQALATKRATSDELDAIRRLIDEMDAKRGGS